MVKRGILSVALGVVLAGAAGAVEVSVFELTGSWRGTGLVRPEPDQRLREGRCRLDIDAVSGDQDVRLQGRCATDLGATALTIQFERRDGGVIAGAMASPSLPETLQFLGKVAGDRLTMQTRAPFQAGDIIGHARFTLTVGAGDTFELVEFFQPQNGAEIEIVRMSFVKTAD